MNGHKPSLLILAAGASSRMKRSLEALQSGPKTQSSGTRPGLSSSVASSTHKGLIPLDAQGRTAIDLLIDQAYGAGITRIILIIQPPGTAFKQHFANNKITVEFAYQNIAEGREKPLGTADALAQCLTQFPELLDQEFIVCNADNLYSKAAFLDLIDSPFENALIGYDRQGLKFPLSKIRNFALLVADKDGCMTELIEKPDEKITERLLSQGQKLNVSMNLWKFKGSDLWTSLQHCPIHPERLEKELPTAVKLMITAGNTRLAVIPRNEHVPDLTQASDIGRVQLFLNQEPKD